MPDQELDEFGIPIKNKVVLSKNETTDEFGIPIKKKDGGSVSANGGKITSQSQSGSQSSSLPLVNTSDLLNEAISTGTSMGERQPKPKPMSYEAVGNSESNADIQKVAYDNEVASKSIEKQKVEAKRRKQQAEEITVDKRLKAKGLKPTTENKTSEIQSLRKQVDSGDAGIVQNNKGEYEYGRTPAWHQAVAKSLYDSVSSLADTFSFIATPKEGLKDLFQKIDTRKQKEARTEFNMSDIFSSMPALGLDEKINKASLNDTPTAQPSMGGELAGMVAGFVPDIAVTAATSGASAIPQTAARLSYFELKNLANTAKDLYDRKTKELIKQGYTEDSAKEQAVDDLKRNSAIAELPSAILNTYLFKEGVTPKPLTQFDEVLKHSIKKMAYMPALAGVQESATQGIEAAEGYKPEWARVSDNMEQFAKMEGFFGALHLLPFAIPKHVKAYIKEAATHPEIAPMIDQALKDNPLSKDIKEELASYAEATAPVREILGDKMNGSYGGRAELITKLNEKITKAEASKKNVPPALHDKIDETIQGHKDLIEKTNKDIERLKTIDNPLKVEHDDINGEPIIPTIETELGTVDKKADATVEKAVIQIRNEDGSVKSTYEGDNHAQALLKAKEAGEDISNINRREAGKFRLSDGTIIDRETAMERFGKDHSEALIEQNKSADEANVKYKKDFPQNDFNAGVSGFTGKDNNFLANKEDGFFTPKEREKYNDLMKSSDTEQEASDMVKERKEEIKASDTTKEQASVPSEGVGFKKGDQVTLLNGKKGEISEIKDGKARVVIKSWNGDRPAETRDLGWHDLADIEGEAKPIEKTKEQVEAQGRVNDFVNGLAEANPELHKIATDNPIAALEQLIDHHKGQLKGTSPATKAYSENAIAKFEALKQDYKLANDKPATKSEVVSDVSEPLKVDERFTARGGNKVVDDKGEPVSVYHGTNKRFDKLDVDKPQRGLFFTKSKESANGYANKKGDNSGTVREANISLTNPYIIDAKGKSYDSIIVDLDKVDMATGNGVSKKMTTDEIVDALRGRRSEKIVTNLYGSKEKADGIIIKNVRDNFTKQGEPTDIYIPFKNEQVLEKTTENETQNTKEPNILTNEGSPTSNEPLTSKEASSATAEVNKVEPTASEGQEPPTPPTETPTVDKSSPNVNGTPIKMSRLTDAKEYFRKVGISWDKRSEEAMGDLSKYARENDFNNYYEAAQNKIQQWLGIIQSGAKFIANSDETIQIGYFRHATIQAMAFQSELMNSPVNLIADAASNEFIALSNRLQLVDTVLGASGSEAGAAFGLRNGLFSTAADVSLKIEQAKLKSKIAKVIKKVSSKSTGKAQDILDNAEAEVTRIHEEELEVDKKMQVQSEKDAEDRFNKAVKEEVDKRLADLKNKTKNNKLSGDKSKKVADNLRGIADRVENFVKAKGAEGAGAAGANFQKAAADAIRYIADKIESGRIPDLIDQAIKKFTKEGVDEKELRDKISEHLLEAGIDKSDIEAPTSKRQVLDKIKDLSKNEDATNITKETVKKGLVNDLINSYLDEGMPIEKVIGAAVDDLKEIFPDIERKQVRDAYLKEGEFTLPTKENLNQDRTRKATDLKRLEDLTKKYTDLVNEGKVYEGKNNGKISTKIERQSDAAKIALDAELLRQGIKKEMGTANEKSSKAERLNSHVDRLKTLKAKVIGMLSAEGLSEGQTELLNKIKKGLDKASISDEAISSIQDNEQLLDKSVKQIRSLLTNPEFKKFKLDAETLDLRKGLQKIIDDADKDKKKSDLALSTERTINSLKSQIAKIDKDIQLGNFDKKTKVVPKPSAEIFKLQKEKRLKQLEYDKVAEKVRNENLSGIEKGLKTLRILQLSDIISGFATDGAVLASGLTKQPLETLSKITSGQLAPRIFPSLAFDAGAEGLTSLRQEKARYAAMYSKINESDLNKQLTLANEKYDLAEKSYADNLDKASLLKEELGADSTEYNNFTKEVLKKSLNEAQGALMDSFVPALRLWIGGNSWEDAARVLLKGAARLDELMGRKSIDKFSELSNFDKASYIIEFMGRLHGMFKNFSARGEFAAGFVSRMENKLKAGRNIGELSFFIETANEALGDFDRGKYQQLNFLNSIFKRLGSGAKEYAESNPNNSFAQIISKGTEAILKAKVPVAKTGLNILDEAITEYWFGLYKGAALHIIEAAKGVGKQGLVDVLRNEKTVGEVRTQMLEHIKGLDSKSKDMILRAYRKGGLGYFLKAVALLGYVAYGGSYTKFGGKKKQEGDKGYDNLPLSEQLNFGEVALGNEKLGKELSHVFTHVAAFHPFLGELDYARTKKMELMKGKTDEEAANTALIRSFESELTRVPYLDLNFGGMFSKPTLPVPFGTAIKETQAFFDRDEKGKMIDRKATDWKERIELKVPFMRKKVGYGEGVAQISAANKWYNKKRKNERAKGATTQEIDATTQEQKNTIEELKKAKTREEAKAIIDQLKRRRQ